ncbi:hypothetical protein PsorP6_011743 [Peronosclerospora sorghi]|uniref:Uncharacterized protein n=1 Tax=Peronosclerospora sorghi TaxID=230839 RepID=A0ACC0WJ97_9STRA|nr:hypothetical protein PsorP6_011743 [Peronosclerospora sorghi]
MKREEEREAERELVKNSVLSLHQDFLRLMNIVDLQMQIPSTMSMQMGLHMQFSPVTPANDKIHEFYSQYAPVPRYIETIKKRSIDAIDDMNEAMSTQSKRQKTLSATKLSKRQWSSEEDEALEVAVQTMGANDWPVIARLLPGRCGKQCRERWVNHLSPDVNKEAWTEQEDLVIFNTRDRIGNRWADI